MYAADVDEGRELRALLRTLRASRTQAEIALAASVSTSLYKRLESGRLRNMRLGRLIRVSEALGARAADRERLIRLARPDLTPLVCAGRNRSAEATLASLYKLAPAVLRARTRPDAVRAVVELLHTALRPDYLTFALERTGADDLRLGTRLRGSASAGRDIAVPIPPRLPASGIESVDRGAVRVLYAPVGTRSRAVAALGIAYDANRNVEPEYRLFLETVVDILDMRLGRPLD
jgi:hypothetical protein